MEQLLCIIIGAGNLPKLLKWVNSAVICTFLSNCRVLLSVHNMEYDASLKLYKTTTQCQCATGHIIGFCGVIVQRKLLKLFCNRRTVSVQIHVM